MHQFVTFATASPFQEAIAAALQLPDAFYEQLHAEYRARRDRLVAGLSRAGLPPLPVEGTYFANADVSSLARGSDVETCRFLTREVGVAAIPLSPFHSGGAPVAEGPVLARFAFCKTDATLDEGVRRLVAWAEKQGPR